MTKIASYFDSAILKPHYTPDDVAKEIKASIEGGSYSVCVRPCDLPLAVKMCEGTETKVSVVLGFPHGAQTTAVKVFEAKDSMQYHPVDVDMVNNIGWVRAGMWKEYEDEIRAVAEVVHAGGAKLKVIFETSQLTVDEITAATRACVRAGADFVKTSTGFTGGGASEEAVQAMLAASEGKIAVKASGGIRDIERAEMFVKMGCERLGVGSTSVPVIVAGEKAESDY